MNHLYGSGSSFSVRVYFGSDRLTAPEDQGRSEALAPAFEDVSHSLFKLRLNALALVKELQQKLINPAGICFQPLLKGLIFCFVRKHKIRFL
jgi:hypothetical protein